MPDLLAGYKAPRRSAPFLTCSAAPSVPQVGVLSPALPPPVARTITTLTTLTRTTARTCPASAHGPGMRASTCQSEGAARGGRPCVHLLPRTTMALPAVAVVQLAPLLCLTV